MGLNEHERLSSSDWWDEILNEFRPTIQTVVLRVLGIESPGINLWKKSKILSYHLHFKDLHQMQKLFESLLPVSVFSMSSSIKRCSINPIQFSLASSRLSFPSSPVLSFESSVSRFLLLTNVSFRRKTFLYVSFWFLSLTTKASEAELCDSSYLVVFLEEQAISVHIECCDQTKIRRA
jgi:hypothetical protein